MCRKVIYSVQVKFCAQNLVPTGRGNYRQAKKYAFLAEYSEVDFEAELLLKDWIAEQNARKPYRKISNVQILEIQKIAYGILDIRS